mmetsp:Transcript_24525/g.36437  ORF Transcript_24525/g.36437 Transcript_24525/m.36437 type:complete len:247 (+) Transcript_24525:1127-1867(+)
MIQWNTASALHQDPISCRTAPSNLNHLSMKTKKRRLDMFVHCRTYQHLQKVAVKQEKHLKRNQGETMHTSVDHHLLNMLLPTAAYHVGMILLTAVYLVGMSLTYLEMIHTPTIAHRRGMIPITADRRHWQLLTSCSLHLLLLVTTWACKNSWVVIQVLCTRRCVGHPSILLPHLEKGVMKQDTLRMNPMAQASCGLLKNKMRNPVKEATTHIIVMRVATHLIVITKVVQNQMVRHHRHHHQTTGNE